MRKGAVTVKAIISAARAARLLKTADLIVATEAENHEWRIFDREKDESDEKHASLRRVATRPGTPETKNPAGRRMTMTRAPCGAWLVPAAD